MASSVSALSRTLESITLIKIKELEKQRFKYESRKNAVIELANRTNNQRARIEKLLEGLGTLYPEASQRNSIINIRHWLEQSQYDVSVPTELLQSYEKLLRAQLEVPSRKLELGHLYARLLTEWMSPPQVDENTMEEDDFQLVNRQQMRLEDLRAKFMKVVFQPLDTDEVEIDLHLNELFQGNGGEETTKPLKVLRDTIGNSCDKIFSCKSPFDLETLEWCIDGLLAEDLLSEEKQQMLRNFLENKTVLKEMSDVLNMRFSDIENWEWDAGEFGIPVLPRQQLNGKYRIWMDEDVLQAILIHYIGIKCCVELKKALNQFISSESTIWKWHTGPQSERKERHRRRYYLAHNAFPYTNLNAKRREKYLADFFMSQLPSTVRSITAYDASSGDRKGQKSTNIKQRLLRTLAAEITLQKSTKGEVALVQTDFEWFATGLSHTTIFACMRFFGYSESAIAFFRKVLRAPLNVEGSLKFPSNHGPITRVRGVPMAHAPEKLIGELILFIMDLVVNQEDGMLLYRLHDDLWFCGDPGQCARAWQALNRYAAVLGLEFNRFKTGSVYISDKGQDPSIASTLPSGAVRFGHLILNSESGKWEIDRVQVEQHVTQLKKQLNGCKSVLEWIQTWNSCMGRFFSHTFGEPAFCFGVEHIDSILETYRWMQAVLFGDKGSSSRSGQGVVGHVRAMIQDRFHVGDVPDAFIYLPEELGGLGLRNPFVSLLTLRDDLKEGSPSNILENMFKSEEKAYKKLKKDFEALGNVKNRVRAASKGNGTVPLSDGELESIFTPHELEQFFSIEEFRLFRDSASSEVVDAYVGLHKIPHATSLTVDSDIRKVLRDEMNIGASDEDTKAIEARWALQMYGDILRRDFGGVRLVDKDYLPLGVLTMMRSRAIRWTMVL